MALVVFVTSYALVVTEDLTPLPRSKPRILAAGFIWVIDGLQLERETVEGS